MKFLLTLGEWLFDDFYYPNFEDLQLYDFLGNLMYEENYKKQWKLSYYHNHKKEIYKFMRGNKGFIINYNWKYLNKFINYSIANKFNHNFDWGPFKLYDKNYRLFYFEDSDGFWAQNFNDLNGNHLFYKNFRGYTWNNLTCEHI